MIDFEADIQKSIFMLDNLLTLSVEDEQKHGRIFEKFFLIRNCIVRYYEIHRDSLDFYNNTNNVRVQFVFYLGIIIGCVEFYKQNNHLTQEQMINLNKIYKGYKNDKA